jgi:magnesium transporter
LARPGVKVKNILNDDVIFVKADVDQEEVALVFKKYDLVSLPVVDEEKRLIGRITVDDIVDVIEDEASEDVQKMAGITELDISEMSPLRVTRSRLPWLIVAFIGQIVSGFLLSMFESTMEAVIYSVLLIPLIMALGGNVGTQSAMVIIRGFATGEIALMETRKRLRSELGVAFLLGIFFAICIYFISGFWFHDFKLGFAISIALIIVVLNAALTGALLPFLLRRINVDPAVATSPFITTTNDILGLLIYFGTISIFLRTV